MLPSACTALLQHSAHTVLSSGTGSQITECTIHRSNSLGYTGGKDVHITLSHEVGQLGLLEREDASFLNAALRPLASRVIPAFQRALQEAGIQARLQLTSNDGTLISAQTAQKVGFASTAGTRLMYERRRLGVPGM